MDYFTTINECRYLSLANISEIESNYLKLVVEEAVVSEESEDHFVGDVPIGKVHPIITTAACRKFEIIFERYIAYVVLNESFASVDKSEKCEGRLYRICESSTFLDYLKQATFASDQYPGPFKLYCFGCMDHIIEVASPSEPLIRMYY